METETTSNVHTLVIKDCISKVRDEFISNGGPGENVLKELQETWEKKMAKVGAIQSRAAMQNPALEGAISPVHTLHVEDAEPLTDVIFPPQQSSSLMNQRPPLDFDLNVEYVKEEEKTETQDFPTVSSGQRKRRKFSSNYGDGANIPQEDGVGDDPKESPLSYPHMDTFSPLSIISYQETIVKDYNLYATPAPFDDDELLNENVDEPLNDDDDEPLNENDDVDDVDDVNDLNETNRDGENIILAQFEKVTRAKSIKGRWYCTLTNGFAHLNNKVITFKKATGELDF